MLLLSAVLWLSIQLPEGVWHDVTDSMLTNATKPLLLRQQREGSMSTRSVTAVIDPGPDCKILLMRFYENRVTKTIEMPCWPVITRRIGRFRIPNRSRRRIGDRRRQQQKIMDAWEQGEGPR